MEKLGRFFLIALVTFIIVIFVIDFQMVVDGFGSFVDGVSELLSPIKGSVK